MPVTRFLTPEELSKKLNYSRKEIDDLVLKRMIPFHEKDGKITFPMEEVLAKFTPRKKAPAKKTKAPIKETKPEETASLNNEGIKDPFDEVAEG